GSRWLGDARNLVQVGPLSEEASTDSGSSVEPTDLYPLSVIPSQAAARAAVCRARDTTQARVLSNGQGQIRRPLVGEAARTGHHYVCDRRYRPTGSPRTCRGRAPEADARRPAPPRPGWRRRSEEHTSELQSRSDLVCRLLLEKKKEKKDLVDIL